MSIRRRLDPRRRRANGVDTHDVAAFRSVVNRTGIVRAILAGGALALVLAAAASARDPQTSERALHSAGSSRRRRSRSLAQHHRRRLRADPADASPARRRGGVDRPRRLLRRAVRAAAAGHAGRGAPAVPPTAVAPRLGPVQNPWTQTFRAGTRISVAVDLAKSILERDEVDAGSILLVSDLETAPDDVPSLARTIAEDRPRRDPASHRPARAVERRAEPLRRAAREGRDRRIRAAVARRRRAGRRHRPGSRSRRRCSCSARSHFSSSRRTSGLRVASRFRALGTPTEASRDAVASSSSGLRSASERSSASLVALALGLLALDIARSRDALAQGDVQYRISPERLGLWRAATIVPSDLGGLAHRHRGRRGASTGRALGAARAPRRPHGLGVRPRDRAAAQRRPGATRRASSPAMRTRGRSRARPGCSA